MMLEAEAVYETGVLKLEQPLPLAEHERVTVHIVPRSERLSQDAWREIVMSTAGKWEGELERPDQGQLETREPLS
jgi:predicted DNA-binding antitoxin AbrB/MazE fold protein